MSIEKYLNEINNEVATEGLFNKKKNNIDDGHKIIDQEQDNIRDLLIKISPKDMDEMRIRIKANGSELRISGTVHLKNSDKSLDIMELTKLNISHESIITTIGKINIIARKIRSKLAKMNRDNDLWETMTYTLQGDKKTTDISYTYP